MITVVETQNSVYVVDSEQHGYFRAAKGTEQHVYSQRMSYNTWLALRAFHLPCVCDLAQWRHLHLFAPDSELGILTSPIENCYTVLPEAFYARRSG